jgi:hypothetical protein
MDFIFIKALGVIVIASIVGMGWIKHLLEEKEKAEGWWICEYCGGGWDSKEKKCKGCGWGKTN